ncbi:hypothetical protein [Pedobacter sp. MR22-3]|uniref:hypothetical protein n=1 Tax=Pedobacter sp. MR22-3 TaxID=2994552 RepID=UPI00224676C9|nr:hypothetical protein [Pedobacter sp. MR22-3]MCX2583905.1 hypothetical protein [Pedobacter sp. MR22-3]
MSSKNKPLIFLLPLLPYIFLKYQKLSCFPDALGLQRLDPGDYFGLILNITASVLGVLITVVLLMFQMNKDTLLRRKGENFTDKPMILTIIVVSLSILVLGFISYITIPKFLSSQDVTIGYLIGYLFIGFIALIFPAIKDILDELNTLKIAGDRIKSLVVTDFFRDEIQLNDYTSLGSDHPLSRIRHDLTIAVRNGDYEAYTQILSELNIQAGKLYGNGSNRILTHGIMNGLSYVWKESIFEASRNNIKQFYRSLWDTLGNLFADAATEKAPLLHFQELEHFIYEHIQFLSRNNMGDALTEGVWMLAEALGKNLGNNSPTQDQISELYHRYDDREPVAHNINASMQWHYIKRFLGFIESIQLSAIENQDRELYQTCGFHSNSILNDIAHETYPLLGDYQVADLAIDIIWHQKEFSKNAIKAGLFNNIFSGYEINTHFISYAIRKQAFYLKEVMRSISDFMVTSQRNGNLAADTIVMFGAIGRHACAMYVGNQMANKVVGYVVRTFKQMKDDIELDPSPVKTPNYLEIKKQLESQKAFLIRDNPDLDAPILIQIAEILSAFNTVESDTETDIVPWDEQA